MPLPKRRKGQTVKSFVSSCIGKLTKKGEFKSQKQRIAICLSQARKKKR